MTQLPSHLARYQSRDLGSALSKNLGATSPPHVSIANGRFTLVDAAGNEQPCSGFDQRLGVYLDACIIDANDHISRVYYAAAFDPSAARFSPPDCWSDNGVGPSVQASNPQSPTCAACPQAVWGSAVSAKGAAIPACQMVQKLALLIPQVPQAVFLLRVPPNSHKNLRAYNELSKRSGVDVSNVITRIYFDPSVVGTLLFTGVNWIDESIAQDREQAYVEKKTDTIVGRTDVARSALAAPAQAQQIAPPVQPNINQAGMGYLNPMAAPALVQPQANPGPFAPAAANPSTATSAPVSSVSPMINSGAPTASPSDAAAPQRRRRRVASEAPAAEPAAAATVPPQGAPAFGGGAAPQAPFPHSGQQTSAALPNVAFGMSEGAPAGENAEVASALNNFFGN